MRTNAFGSTWSTSKLHFGFLGLRWLELSAWHSVKVNTFMSGRKGKNVGRPSVAFGPIAAGWGSWEWVGDDTCQALSPYFETSTFGVDEFPRADVVVVIKHLPPAEVLSRWSEQSAVVYCPIDYFGTAAAIDQAASSLRYCSRIVVHAESLCKYLLPYGRVQYMDHHVKFIGPGMTPYLPDGYLLWVGVRTNLPPLEAWLKNHLLPRELWVLTNFEVPTGPPPPLQTGGNRVRVMHWTPAAHESSLREAGAALDLKGADFRSRHKPPAKALDFLAAGIPLAMNADSSSSQHIHRLGFDLAAPDDTERWLSWAYWEETRRFGAAIRELLSLERIARRWKLLLDDVCAERANRTAPTLAVSH